LFSAAESELLRRENAEPEADRPDLGSRRIHSNALIEESVSRSVSSEQKRLREDCVDCVKQDGEGRTAWKRSEMYIV